jgi:hypothetical protein
LGLGLKLGRHLRIRAILDYSELSWTATGIEFTPPLGPEVGVAHHFGVISAPGLENFSFAHFQEGLEFQ